MPRAPPGLEPLSEGGDHLGLGSAETLEERRHAGSKGEPLGEPRRRWRHELGSDFRDRDRWQAGSGEERLERIFLFKAQLRGKWPGRKAPEHRERRGAKLANELIALGRCPR